jgi:PAS domain S-box-containing protein
VPAPAALLDSLFESAPSALAVVDRELRYLKANERLAALNGVPLAEMLGKRVPDVVPALWPVLEPLYLAALAGRTTSDHELTGRLTGGGPVRTYRCSYYPVRDGGDVVGVGLVIDDVTERERIREELRVRTDLYAMIAATNRAVAERRTVEELFEDVCRIAVEQGHFLCAWIGVPDGDAVRRVATAGEDHGYLSRITITLKEGDPRSTGPTGRAFLQGVPTVVNDFQASALTSPWHEEAARSGFAASAAFPLRERGKVAAVLTLYAGRAGFFTPALVETLAELTPAVCFGLEAFAEAREHRRDEAALLLRERALRAVSQGICITDPRRPDNPIVYASPGFAKVTGYSEADVLGRNCRFLQCQESDPAALAELRAALRAGRGCSVELQNRRKDGALFWNQLVISPVVDDAGLVTHFVGVQTDVTHFKQLEARVQQTQKLETVGRLAGSIAHDFNNLLTVIGGCASLLEVRLPPDPELEEAVLDISSAAQLAATLTRQLLTFSKKQMVVPRVLDLGAVVKGAEKLLRRLVGEQVTLALRLAPGLGPVRADPGQLEQILVNLAVNARDAMPGGGTLTVETLAVTAPDGARRVCLQVSDTGSGIDAATLPHIFEPFFSTKMPGHGTGLGLSTVREIVEQARGAIAVESAPGKGTTFRIELPCTPGGEEAGPLAATDAQPPGTELVLLAEDDAAVREALSLAAANRGVRLLITDVVMPDVGGRKLAEQVAQVSPGCRALFMSGYTDDEVLRHGVIEAEVAFLHKPYTPAALAQKVRAVLDAG